MCKLSDLESHNRGIPNNYVLIGIEIGFICNLPSIRN